MTKTPDEIKKGLECCCDLMGVMCPYCPYAEDGDASETCREEMAGDSLALIQRLQAENAEQAETIMWMEAKRDDLKRTIRHLEAERDAIMQDMNKNCTSCKHSGMNNPDNPCYKFEEQCRDYSNWQWRGVQKEE